MKTKISLVVQINTNPEDVDLTRAAWAFIEDDIVALANKLKAYGKDAGAITQVRRDL